MTITQVIQSRATSSPRQLIPVQTATLSAAQLHGYQQQQQQGVATPLATNGNAQQQDGTGRGFYEFLSLEISNFWLIK